ncbi:hypothetical protein CAEBREN_32439 [Caenorhabditis brenneri]|uniref:EGF-like domain-containing protein n=1 Tax=Caenorhabditis brenneri TaxID=135651 RepID=G0NYH7_CAEBE|nr:hypothetical protein CAEBREN_32439 [Caenorhabditis brenneri]
MFLKVDGQRKSLKTSFVLPTVYTWIVGSRTEKGSTGFAGVIRNVYLCGVELALGQYARKETERGIALGDDGYCRPDLCQNGGQCIDKYDGYNCDCSMTPFGGNDCTKEYGMMVPAGSSIQIPWQNPAHQAMCHRIAIQTASRNTTILRSKALFADSTFNMTVDDNGNLQMMAYDGFFFNFKRHSKHHNLSDDVMHDISFCASKHHFNVSVDGMQVITIEGNWTFFESFNVWHFLDENFEGCVSRIQTGSAFPLKSPKTARLNYSGKIRFGTCPIEAVSRQQMYDFNPQSEVTPTTVKTSTEDIKIFSVSQNKKDLMSKASEFLFYSETNIFSYFSVIGGGILALSLFILCMSSLICYMRSRPEGVYKTNETGKGSSGIDSEILKFQVKTVLQVEVKSLLFIM